MRKQCLLLWIILALFEANNTFGQTSWQEFQQAKQGEIVVYYTDVVPFLYKPNAGDSLHQGIEYELFNSFLNFTKQAYGVAPKCRYVYVATFGELQSLIQKQPTGTFALGAFSMTDERKNRMQFSPPYMPDVEIMVSSHNLPVVKDTAQFLEQFQHTIGLTLKKTTFEQELLQLRKIQLNFSIEYADKHDQVYDRIAKEDNLFSFTNLVDYLYRNKTRLSMKRQTLFKTEREGLAIAMPFKSDWQEPMKAFFQTDSFPQITKRILQKYIGEDVRELVMTMSNTEGEAQEIALLKEEKIIQEQKILDDEKEIKHQNLINKAFIAFVMVLIVFLVLSYIGFKVQQSQKKLLEKQNHQIETQNTILENREKELQQKNAEIQAKNEAIEKQNESITDSIRAAQVIQNAILPFRNAMENLFKDYFLLYIPQSIVSGDFFWISQVQNKTFVAVIDCTGHGVPGAFMSMIGQAYLNKIVNENHISDPSQVLENFHENVRINLKQDEIKEHTAYGMDVCMVAYENLPTNQVKVQFSGAKRPLLYIHHEKLHEIRGTRRSVGGRPKKTFTPFQTHEIILNSDDLIYLTTDGYVDNGNPNRQSFGSQRFMELIQTNFRKNLTEQGEILHHALLEHQATAEQRDDITILGVKV